MNDDLCVVRWFVRRIDSGKFSDLAGKNIRRVAVNTHFERKEAHEFYEKAGYTRNGFRFVKELPMPAD